MSDLIDRKMAIDAVCRVCLVCRTETCQGRNPDSRWCEEITALREIPSAKPKRGKWTIETIGEIPRYRDSPIYEPIYRCSCCGMTTESYVRFEKPIMPEDADFPKYCSYCGALMEVTE